MQQVLQRAGLVRTAPVENIPGAAGTIGLARFIGAERGRGDTMMVSGLIMLGGIVMHRSPVTLRDVTPIARLTGEYEVIAVPTASPLRSLADFIAALKQRPEAISWGGGSAGGSDQMLAGLVAEAVGVAPRRINYVAFSGGGESLSAIVGGQVTVGVNGLAEFAPHMAAGTLRALAISSADRLPGLDVPTLREQGVNVEFENWRSIVAPPGISGDDRQRLERLVERMTKTAEWQEALARYRWLDRYLAGPALDRFAAAEEARVLAHPARAGNGSERRGDGGLFRPLSSTDPRRPGDHRRRHGGCHTARGWTAARGPAGMATDRAHRRGIAANLLLLEQAGFPVASAVLFWCTARAFDARHPLRDAAFAVTVSLAAYLLFSRLLQLQLPAGPLGRWL